MGSSKRPAHAAPLTPVRLTPCNYSNPQDPLVAFLGGVDAAVLIVVSTTNQHNSCMWNIENKTKCYEEEVRTPAAKKQRQKCGDVENTPRYANRSGASDLVRLGEAGLDISPEAKYDRSV